MKEIDVIVKKFEANDGTRFESKEDCEKHEEEIEKSKSDCMNRIEMIRNKRKQIDEEKAEKLRLENEERKNLINNILSMKDRIKKLIDIANELGMNELLPDDRYSPYGYARESELKKYGYQGHIVASGIYHHLGFNIKRINGYTYQYEVKSLQIEMGGACGSYDLIVDGEHVLSVHEDTKNIRYDIPIPHLKQFVKEFPIFESAFYAWFDETFSK